ncbi:uroporphyrinogen-III synthase [Actinomyces faecalis]|uniref:uroporphyrinogen-III synthase n=1 Tax=Actinomyces faecalis TaxID=2722820 RepID=UPI001556A972|nr:uroporphyrinogen-III synthase [Actinomyces faecalis]
MTTTATTSSSGSPADSVHQALAGRRVLLGRSRTDDPFARVLREAGAEVDALALTVTSPGKPEEVERARTLISSGWPEWVVVTSAQTLEVLDLSRLGASGEAGDGAVRGDRQDSVSTRLSEDGCLLLPPTRLAAVGPRTARALAAVTGRQPDVVGGSDAEALAQALEDAGVGPGTRVLLPQSAIARPVLAERLEGLGAQVQRAAVYTTLTAPASSLPPTFAKSWRCGLWDAVLLTSGSAVRALIELSGPAPTGTAVVTLGRPSQLAAQAAGLQVAAVAPTPTADGVLRAVSQALDRQARQVAAPSSHEAGAPPP